MCILPLLNYYFVAYSFKYDNSCTFSFHFILVPFMSRILYPLKLRSKNENMYMTENLNPPPSLSGKKKWMAVYQANMRAIVMGKCAGGRGLIGPTLPTSPPTSLTLWLTPSLMWHYYHHFTAEFRIDQLHHRGSSGSHRFYLCPRLNVPTTCDHRVPVSGSMHLARVATPTLPGKRIRTSQSLY